MFGADLYDSTPLQAANLLADELERHFTRLGLATNLHTLKIPREAIQAIADRVTRAGTTTVGNYSPLSRADVIAVLERAY